MSDSSPTTTRRDLLIAGTGLAVAAAATGTASAAAPVPTSPTTDRIPMRLPKTEYVYEAIVDVTPSINLGKAPLGERRMVPITGGSFEGPGIRGKVLAGGADRQLWRTDGVRHLDALYEMETDDGVIITVRNMVFVRETPGNPRYAFSHLEITAPEGKYAWLNNFLYVGTLDNLRPQRNAVVVRVYKVV